MWRARQAVRSARWAAVVHGAFVPVLILSVLHYSGGGFGGRDYRAAGGGGGNRSGCVFHQEVIRGHASLFCRYGGGYGGGMNRGGFGAPRTTGPVRNVDDWWGN